MGPHLDVFAAIARDSREYQGHGWGCAWLGDGEWRTRYVRAMNVILASPSRVHVSCRFAEEPDYLASPSRVHVSCRFAEEPDYFQMRERDDGGVRIVCSDPYPGTTGWSRIENGAVLTRELAG